MRSGRDWKRRARLMEKLEPRQLLSAAQIDYSTFTSTTGLVINGFTSAATTHHALVLTDGGPAEARSIFYGAKVPIDTFTSHFSYQVYAGQPGVDGLQEADGFTFVIDNGTTSDLGIGRF